MITSKIQIVRLADGHEYYMPTIEEIKKFKNIVQVVVQETMTNEEFKMSYDIWPDGEVVRSH